MPPARALSACFPPLKIVISLLISWPLKAPCLFFMSSLVSRFTPPAPLTGGLTISDSFSDRQRLHPSAYFDFATSKWASGCYQMPSGHFGPPEQLVITLRLPSRALWMHGSQSNFLPPSLTKRAIEQHSMHLKSMNSLPCSSQTSLP